MLCTLSYLAPPVVTILCVTCCSAGEVDHLVGKWCLKRISVEGELLRAIADGIEQSELELSVSKSKILLSSRHKITREFRFCLHIDNQRNSIDIIADTKVSRGIYKIEDKKLVICVPVGEEGRRPTEFKALSMGQNQLVLTFIRPTQSKVK
jgi:uncharacterized protein (TIGR03067 family)